MAAALAGWGEGAVSEAVRVAANSHLILSLCESLDTRLSLRTPLPIPIVIGSGRAALRPGPYARALATRSPVGPRMKSTLRDALGPSPIEIFSSKDPKVAGKKYPTLSQ